MEYYLKKDGIVINPSVIPQLTKLNLTFTNTQGSNYKIVQPTEVVDNRMRYRLFLNRQIRKTDLVKFQSIIRKYWMTLHNLGNIFSYRFGLDFMVFSATFNNISVL